MESSIIAHCKNVKIFIKIEYKNHLIESKFYFKYFIIDAVDAIYPH